MGEIRACCGFGHRDVFENISDQLYNTLLHIAEQGCKKFYTGGMGEFDKLFSSAVRRIKSMFPDIKLICVKPYMTKDINENGEYLLTLYDDIIIPTELADVHYKAVIQKRNQWMIEESDLLVFYVRRKYGGAYLSQCKAQKLQKRIIYI